MTPGEKRRDCDINKTEETDLWTIVDIEAAQGYNVLKIEEI